MCFSASEAVWFVCVIVCACCVLVCLVGCLLARAFVCFCVCACSVVCSSGRVCVCTCVFGCVVARMLDYISAARRHACSRSCVLDIKLIRY